MSIPIAYITVILTWATTPLGIQWSSEGISPAAGALSRMALAATIGWIVARCLGVIVPWHRPAVRLYLISNIGLFFGLMCIYLGATYIPSGMISVVFGFSPVASAVLSRFLLRDLVFGISRWLAVLMGVAGLLVTFLQDFTLQDDKALTGVLLVACGMLFFSLSAVLVKRENTEMHPLAQCVGSLMLATPLYAISGLFIGLDVESLQPRAVLAILYLTVFGSFIGFFCYFYILKHLAASTVTLVTLVTPLIAISLGVTLNNEALTPNLLYGAGLICSCLVLFNWGDKIVVWIQKRVFYRREKCS